MGRLGYRSTATLREPSLGPIFGIKGGGAALSEGWWAIEDLNL